MDGYPNNQVLYIGDEPRDVHASNKAGVQVIGVSWGLAGEEGLGSMNKDLNDNIIVLTL